MSKPDDNNTTVRRTATLSTGQIVTEHPAGSDGEALYGFGERINPRRSFVFVSRVLGRHVPVSPRMARQAMSRLADNLADDLNGPILITGMAETAVGLGAGVHDAYLQRTQRDDVLNISSTRTLRPQSIFGRFSEDHSHASGHTVYMPALARDQSLLMASRTLIMVDDETSSGNTFRSLATTLIQAGLHRIERIIALTLTDWSSEVITVPSTMAASGHLVAERFSLLSGRFSWTPDPEAIPMVLPDPDVPSSLASAPVHRDGDARIGNSIHTTVYVPEALRQHIEQNGSDHRPVLVLGTGEHVWEPFLLAEAIEKTGVNVRFSATTRSPIITNHDIHCAYSFRDHEELGISNYLYNVNPLDYSSIVICVDTAVENIDASLVLALKAHVLFDNDFFDHQSVTANTGNLEPATLNQCHE
ncbi:MAG: phosphoribosyltransferase domain-containing protein [Granulosicoccus sp.]